MVTVLADGIAYGALLFLLALGLSVTMGVMNVVNLAHGVFAMTGGYVAALAMERGGIPFLATLPLAFAAAALLGVVLERVLYSRLYHRSHLDQVLATVGLVFVASAVADVALGAQTRQIALPDWLRGRAELPGGSVGAYRLFVAACCLALAASLHLVLSRTRFGARLRAAVDDPQVARAMGIPVGRVFALAFAAGSGLAGLGGALGADMIGVDPSFPVRMMVWFLIVVAVGGSRSIAGPLAAAMILGIADVSGKYWLPQVGPFVLYAVMVALLVARPRGLGAAQVSR
jgi:branched-chain amino acid transport system permease protein